LTNPVNVSVVSSKQVRRISNDYLTRH